MTKLQNVQDMHTRKVKTHLCCKTGFFAQIPFMHIIPKLKGCFENSKQICMEKFGSKWSQMPKKGQ